MASPARAGEASSLPAASPAHRAATHRAVSHRVRDAAATLFPATARVPLTRRAVLLASAAVAVSMLVMLLRTPGTGALQSIWEEDSRNVLTDAYYMSGVRNLVTPISGYFVVISRMLGVFAGLFPVTWAAAVLSVTSALVNALLALLVYVASGAHVRHRLTRVLVAAPMLFAPVAENYLSEIYNRPVCVHFFMMYALFWTILWVPASGAGRAVAIATVGVCAMSTILAVGYVPLAILRVLVRRDRTGIAMLGLLLAGGLANYLARLAGLAPRGISPSLDALWATERYVTWGVPESVMGFRAMQAEGALSYVVIIGAWAIVGAVVAVAVWRRVARPTWLLAATAGLTSAWLFAMMVLAQGSAQQRYLLPVEMLILAALALLLTPSGEWVGRRWANTPLVVLGVFIALIGAFNYRWSDTYRSHAPVWRDQVRQAAAECAANPALDRVYVRSAPAPYWSYVTVPCSRLGQRPNDCTPPDCLWLEGPAAVREP